MRKHFLAAAFLFGSIATAHAQATPLQSGPTTPGHVPVYTGDSAQPVIQDSGTAAGGPPGTGLSELSITAVPANGVVTAPYANSGNGQLSTHECIYDAPITNATGFHFLCFDPNAQGGGLLAYGAGGAATPLPFQISVNGVLYDPAQQNIPAFVANSVLITNTVQDFWSPLGAGAAAAIGNAAGMANGFATLGVRTVASGASDSLGAGDVTVKWASATASAKTETVPACSSANSGKTYTVADGAATAGQYNIALTPASGTIGGASSQPINIAGGAQTIQCDGVSNWILE